MNKYEKEVQQSLLDSEAAAIKELEKQYKAALKDITEKVKLFQVDIDLLDQALSQDGLDEATKALLQSQKQSKVYQQNYQQALKGQVSAILDKMQGDNYATIDKYLNSCYETGYIGTMYDIAKQGIPIIAPIDQAAAVKAILTDSKVSKGLYAALGVNVGKLKKTITQEISRGIASGLPYRDIARNISNVSSAPLSRAKTIARTEGHRIQQTSTRDAQYKAKAKGADVLKQWDAALDSRTRDSHARVDGEIRELDEKFSNGLMFPGDPAGGAAEVVNCRCTSDTRARWALDEDELNTLKERAEFFGLDKTENFEDYKEKYLAASEAITNEEKSSHPVRNKNGDTILFDKGMEAEHWEDSVAIIKQLSNEYNTKLVTVREFKKGENKLHVAGDVSAFGEMRLSSKKKEVAVHEFAHSLTTTKDSKMGLDGNDAFWGEIRRVRNEYNKYVRQHPTDKISFYAADNLDEFFAEAFTQAKANQLGIPLPDYYGYNLTYSNKVLSIVDKYFKKPLEDSKNSGIISSVKEATSILTRRKTTADGREIINQAAYHKLTNPVIQKGGTIITANADNDWVRYLDERGATAVTIGDSIIFRADATTTEVLEEVYHFNQNRAGLNSQYSEIQRRIMNEIDAQEYLISVADKYKIPKAEREETKALLESYIKQMEELKKAGEWDD